MFCLRLASLAFFVFFCSACQGESTLQNPVTLTLTLSHLLKDPDPDVRQTAALSLGKIAHPSGIPGLKEALKDHDARVREYSAWAIGEIGELVDDATIIGVVATLGDLEPSVQRASALALGRLPPNQSVIDALGEALSVGRVSSRQATVDALMHLASPRAYPSLVEVLQDPDPAVRQGAVAALGEWGDPQVLPDLRKRLLYDSAEGVRTEAAFRLGKLGGKEDLSVLQKAADRDPTAMVHLWSVWAIEHITEDTSTPPQPGAP